MFPFSWQQLGSDLSPEVLSYFENTLLTSWENSLMSFSFFSKLYSLVYPSFITFLNRQIDEARRYLWYSAQNALQLSSLGVFSIFCTERSSLSSLGVFSIFHITTGDSVTKLSTKSNKDPLSFNFPKHLCQFPSIFPLSPSMSIKLPSAPWPQNQYNIFRFYYDSPPFSGTKLPASYYYWITKNPRT